MKILRAKIETSSNWASNTYPTSLRETGHLFISCSTAKWNQQENACSAKKSRQRLSHSVICQLLYLNQVIYF